MKLTPRLASLLTLPPLPWAGTAVARPTFAGFLVNLAPVFAAVISAALPGTAPARCHGMAFALIVGGIVVSSR